MPSRYRFQINSIEFQIKKTFEMLNAMQNLKQMSDIPT